MPGVAWEPTPDYVERANVTRLMRAHGVETIDQLRRRSVEDIGWYWNAAVEDLDIRFRAQYERVYDDSRGIPWTTWFEGRRR
jgi:acetyl-CoA synthetase